MKEEGLVSVILPVYNAAGTILRAVASVLGQSHHNVELIVVDDRSTDNTRDELRSVSDPRLQLIELQSNCGPGRARNTGMDASKGEWISFIDADDAWRENRLTRLLSFPRDPNRQTMIADGLTYCFTVGGELTPWRLSWSSSDLRVIEGNQFMDLATFMGLSRQNIKPLIPRHIIFDNRLRQSNRLYGEDIEFLIRAFKYGARLMLTKDSDYLYARTPGSLTSNPEKAKIIIDMYRNLLTELEFTKEEENQILGWLRVFQRQSKYIPFIESVKRGQIGTAAREILENPWILPEFMKRLPGSLYYKSLVRLHGGLSR